jgi:hypothetical protein
MTDTSWTAVEVEAEAEMVRSKLSRAYAANKGAGGISTMMFFYASRNPSTREPEKMLILCPDIPIPDVDVEGGRARVGAMLRAVASECEASGVIFVTEAWTLEPPSEIAAQGEKAVRTYFESQGDWSSHPDRKEIVQVQVEHHRIGVKFWFAYIERDEEGIATLGEWMLLKTVVGGRFADFLDRQERS